VLFKKKILPLHAESRDMRKRTIVIVTILLMAMQSVMGQIIYTSEDQGTHLRGSSGDPNFGVMVPLQGLNYDQWTQTTVPLGEGLLLLVGLGGAYLLKKKSSKK
jgi:hypothetical protein